MIRAYPGPEHRAFTVGRSSKRVLLIHGFPGTPWEVRALGELLAANGYQAHAPLLPGFGPEIHQLADRRRNDWEAGVEAALRGLLPGARRLIVVGYSMGGALAVRLAARRSLADSLDRLVLINPFSGLELPVGPLLSLITNFVSSYRPFVRADFDDPAVREVLGRILPDLDVDDLSWRERVRHEVRVPLRAVDEVVRLGTAAWREAPRTRLPTLVVQGQEDEVIPPRRTRRLADRLGGPVRLVESSGGHVLVWPGKPGHEELKRSLLDFLEPGRGECWSATTASREEPAEPLARLAGHHPSGHGHATLPRGAKQIVDATERPVPKVGGAVHDPGEV